MMKEKSLKLQLHSQRMTLTEWSVIGLQCAALLDKIGFDHYMERK